MSSPGFNILIILVLLLSIGAKTAAASGEPEENFGGAVEAARNMLADAGFEARVRHLPRSPGIVVEAAAGDCRLLAGEYSVYDTLAEAYRDLAKPVDRIRYVYRGTLFETPPKTRSMIDYFVWRELGRVGIATDRAPVIALILSPRCDAAALPWERVALLRD